MRKLISSCAFGVGLAMGLSACTDPYDPASALRWIWLRWRWLLRIRQVGLITRCGAEESTGPSLAILGGAQALEAAPPAAVVNRR
jgi:hypothetical protein